MSTQRLVDQLLPAPRGARWIAATLAMSLLLMLASSVGASEPVLALSSQWSLLSSQTARQLEFVDQSNGWAFGSALMKTSDGGASWAVQYQEPGRSVNDGIFLDADHGWAVGDDGLILVTSNGGTDWTPQDSGTTQDLHAVTFLDTQTAWAVGGDETILHTVDGGAHWNVQREGWLWTLYAVDFYDALRGCALGANFTAVYTADGGTTWTESRSAITAGHGIHFSSATAATAIGLNGRMAETVDGGKTWSLRATGTDHDLLDIEFINERVGWVGGSDVLLHTCDAGRSWTLQEAPGTNGPTSVSAVDINCVWGGASDGLYRGIHGGTAGASGWSTVVPTAVPLGDGPAAGAIEMTDSTHGWALGTVGQLLHTSDGVSWMPLATGATHQLDDVAAVDDQNVWAVSIWGDIVHTGDGGVTWVPQGQVGWQLTAVRFVDTTHGWALGWAGRILNTADGGAHWSPQSSRTAKNLWDVWFFDRLRGWAVGDAGTVLRTSNGGVSWAKQTSGTTQALRSVCFADALNGWAAGSSGVVVRTSDGGKTWRRQKTGVSAVLECVAFADDQHGWAAGSEMALIRTEDGGASWRSQVPGGGGCRSVAAVTPECAWATGCDGSILVTRNGGVPFAPVTSASGLAATDHTGWRRTAQTVSLSVEPGIDPASPAGSFFSVDGGPAVSYSAPFTVSGHGNHIIRYWSADVDDRLESMRVGYVNIDRAGPICEALKGVTVRRGATATLRFVIDDRAPTCGYANVMIRISRNGRVVKTIRKTKVRENVERSVRFAVALPRGAYRWTVSAKDIVGNRSVRNDSRSLFVE